MDTDGIQNDHYETENRPIAGNGKFKPLWKISRMMQKLCMHISVHSVKKTDTSCQIESYNKRVF